METLTLTDLAARLAGRWRLLVAGGAIGLLLGVGLHAALPTHFAATTVVLVESTELDRVDMAAERAIAASRRVMAEAADTLGGSRDDTLDVETLERSVDPVVVDGSRLLRITCTRPSARAASRGADAVAQAYLAARAVDAAGLDGQPIVEATVVDPARTPRSPVGPGLPATVLGTTLLAVMAACGVVVAITRRPAAPAS